MKILKFLFLFIFLAICALVIGGLIKYNIDLKNYTNQAPKPRPKTQDKTTNKATAVYVLGTRHFESDYYKRDDLYEALDSIAPDIILYECDEKKVNRILKNQNYFFQLLNTFKNRKEIEKPVVLKYIKNNPNCKVLAYEWEKRDQYHREHQILSKPQEVFAAIKDLNKKGLLTTEQSKGLDDFFDMNKQLHQLNQKGRLKDFNNMETDYLIARRQIYQYSTIKKLVDERADLAEYKAFAKINEDYWMIRNQAMAKNILQQIELHQGKTIVVLNGFYHRYYLLHELQKAKHRTGSFELKEL